MIKVVELFVNNTKPKALELSERIKEELLKEGYILSCGSLIPDLVIGFGGDGTLLKWLSENDYATRAKYIGINCGTLGFLQDFEVDDVHNFVLNIPNYYPENLNFISLEIISCDGSFLFNSLNEFSVISNVNKSFRCRVDISDEFLEDFVGTGLIFSSPTGSTAHSLSSVGCIVYPGIEAIQMTPSEAIVNRELRCLPKSICIPKDIITCLYPSNDDEVQIISDGIKVFEGNYVKMSISYSNSHMTKLTNCKNSFVKKVREKLI